MRGIVLRAAGIPMESQEFQQEGHPVVSCPRKPVMVYCKVEAPVPDHLSNFAADPEQVSSMRRWKFFPCRKIGNMGIVNFLLILCLKLKLL